MKVRLDKELINRGLVPSRSKSQELITEGYVLVNGNVVKKSNTLVSEDDILELKENDKLKYVSRGGLKLEKAINEFNIDFSEKNIMDIGSSTGGFCDCSLKHGAKHITAIDVGTDLMVPELRVDPRISLYEQTNFKELDNSYFKNIDIITVDVSFISLLKVINKVKEEGINVEMVTLIKPQFECGKEVADRYKGVILNKDIHLDIVNNVVKQMNEMGFYLIGLTVSPIKGGDGNIEYVAYISNKIKNNEDININNIVRTAFIK